MEMQKVALNKAARSVKKRYLKTRGKARWVGFFYLLAAILVTAIAGLPLLAPQYKGSSVELGVMGFWKAFLYTDAAGEVLNFKGVIDGFKAGTLEVLGLNHVMAILYAIMFATIVINLIRMFCQLGDLYSNEIDREELETLNDNVSAMEKMGKIFSGSVACLITFNFFIACLSDKMPIKDLVNVGIVPNVPNMLIAFAVVVVFHLLLGGFGGNVSLFNVEEFDNDEGTTYMGLNEKKKPVGQFVAFVRNILQIVAVIGMMYFFIGANNLQKYAELVASKKVVENLTSLASNDIMTFIAVVLQLVAMLSLLILIKHATATTEFNRDGAKGAGMKNFRVFCMVMLVAVAGFYYLTYGTKFDFEATGVLPAILLAVVSLVMFVVEILFRNHPRTVEDDRAAKAAKAEKKAIKAEKAALKRDRKAEKAAAKKEKKAEKEAEKAEKAVIKAEKKALKAEKKAEKKAAKQERKAEKQVEKQDKKEAKAEKKALKKELKAEKAAAKKEKKAAKKARKAEKKVLKAEKKAAKKARKAEKKAIKADKKATKKALKKEKAAAKKARKAEKKVAKKEKKAAKKARKAEKKAIKADKKATKKALKKEKAVAKKARKAEKKAIKADKKATKKALKKEKVAAKKARKAEKKAEKQLDKQEKKEAKAEKKAVKADKKAAKKALKKEKAAAKKVAKKEKAVAKKEKKAAKKVRKAEKAAAKKAAKEAKEAAKFNPNIVDINYFFAPESGYTYGAGKSNSNK